MRFAKHRIAKQAGVRTFVLTACAAVGLTMLQSGFCPLVAAEDPPPELDAAIAAAAKLHGVPEHLVRRIIMRESKYNPRARNRNFWGLMQISYPTAKSMGFKGTREQLLNPFVNLRYAVPYLANAFVIAGKQEDAAVRLYAAGYYFTARSRGLLTELRTADSAPIADEPAPALAANAVAQPPQSIGFFGALFGPGSQPAPAPAPQPAVAEAALAPQPADVQPAVTPSASDNATDTSIAMVAGKDGSLVPPKKWARDGGTTVIAKGEQSPDGYALRTPVNETPRKVARGHAHKFTEVASLDVPASSAQAYAAGQAAEARAADPQAAIANATSGSTPTDAPVAAGQGAAEPQPRAGRSVADGKQVRHLALAKADAGRARQVKRKPSDAPNTRQASAEPTAVAAPAR